MATIDSLEISVQSKVDDANKSLDILIQKLGLVAEGISAVGRNNALDGFAKKALETAKGLSNIQNMAKGISSSITPEMQKASKSFEQIAAQYANLGKNFSFKGSTSEIQKQIDRYTNSLEVAKLKKEELETAGKTEGKAYEAAVAKTVEYTNVIENLKQQLAEMQAEQPQFDFNINGLEETRQAIESVGESIRGSVSLPESAFNYNAEAMTAVFGEAAANVQNYTQAIEQFGRNAGMVLNESPQLGRLNEESQAAAERIKVLGERLSQLTVPEVREENLGKLQSELDKTEIKLDELRVKLKNGLTMGNITESVDSSGYVRLQEQIALTERQAEALRAKIAEVESQSGSSGGIERFRVAFEKLASVGKTVKSALSGVASTLGKIGSAAKNVMSGITKLAKSLSGLGKSSKATNVSLVGGFKTVLKYAFGIRSLYVLFNKLRTAMKEGFKNLAQYSSETNSSLSMLQSSLGALKNSLAVAFAPIVNVVAPYLSMFIDMVTKAFNTLGQFFAVLTGKSFTAQAVKNFSDYAAGISKAGGAAKKAGKDVKNGVRAFDELKTISMNQEDDSDGGGADISPEDMFETVPIDSSVSDFVQKIKDAWANADFAEIGEMLGIKLKSALDSIPWEPIKETAAKIGKSFATLINGFVEVDGLADSIGRTIGEAINTGITGINSFLDNTHWDSAGIFIGEGLNGIINSVDWGGLGHLFAAKWNAIFEVIGNAATTFDWSNFGLQLASSVNTFITDFDWAENGARLGALAQGILDTILVFIENTNWQEIGDGVGSFITAIDWSGMLESVTKGIGDLLNISLSLISDFVFNTDWAGMASQLATSINSLFSAIDWGEVGNTFISGINSIVSFLGSFIADTDWYGITADLMDMLTSAILNLDWAGLGKTVSDAAMGILDMALALIGETDWGALIQNILAGIGGFIENIDWGGILAKLGVAIVELVAQIPGILIGAIGGIADLIGSLFSALGLDGIAGFFKGIGDALSNVGTWLKEHLVDPVVNWVKNLFGIHSPSKIFLEIGSFLMQGLFNGISSLVDKVVSVFTKIKDKIVNIWIAIKTKTSEVWSGIINAVKTPINAIIGFINGMTSGISSGINGLIDALNTLKIDVPSWVTTLTGIEAFGFNISNISIPQIPMLANGAVLRGGNPFLAVVNDQKRGQTNVETPLKVIQEALREELTKFSAKVQIAMPNTRLLSFNYEPAPVPSLAGAYGNYRYDTGAYTGNSFDGRNSGLLGMSEAQVYNLFYNATSAAINNSKLMNDQKDMVEGILKKPTMEIGEVHDRLVKDSFYKGANCCGGNMQRFVTADELYR